VLLVGVPTALLIANLGYVTAIVSADVLLIAAVMTAQWRRARRDPVARGALHLIGGVTVATLVTFLLLYLPGVGGTDPVLGDAASFWVVLPPFLAVAVRRQRGAAAAYRYRRGAGPGVGLTAGSAASAALLAGGAMWIVARQALVERAPGRSRSQEEGLYGAAGAVALAATPGERFGRWTAALDACFSPLERVPVGADARQAAVEEVVAAVRLEASGRLAGAGIVLTVTEDGVDARPLDAEVGCAAESAAREAVTNVLRHSGASRVDLRFAVAGGWLRVELDDYGCRPAGVAPGEGSGLANMAQRLASVGGSAAVAAGPRGGTHARFRLPPARGDAGASRGEGEDAP